MDDTALYTDIDAAVARLRERAAELGLQPDDDEALLEAVLQHDIAIPEPGEAECQRYYTQHADSLRQGDVVEADHILFAVTPATPIDLLRVQAEQTLNSLLKGEADFAEMARGVSNCPSAQIGGNLGQLSRGDVVPEFWEALIAHGQPGLLPRLVRTRYGLHIVRLHRVATGQVPPFEMVRPLIASRLREQALVSALRLYAEDLHRQIAPDDEQPTVQCPV